MEEWFVDGLDMIGQDQSEEVLRGEERQEEEGMMARGTPTPSSGPKTVMVGGDTIFIDNENGTWTQKNQMTGQTAVLTTDQAAQVVSAYIRGEADGEPQPA